jgi:methionyl-tRNA formyltransferase
VAAIDWSKPASDVYNLVRGCDPQPGAYLIFKDDKVRLYKARLLASKQDKRPGEILDIGKGEIMVALNGGALGIGKVRDSSGQKMGADEFAKKMDLQVGMPFGS